MASEQFLTVDDQPISSASPEISPILWKTAAIVEILRQYIIEQELQTRDDLY